MIASAREGNPVVERFDCSVFTGEYITGDVDASYLNELAQERSDLAKAKKNGELGDDEVIGLHNSTREMAL